MTPRSGVASEQNEHTEKKRKRLNNINLCVSKLLLIPIEALPSISCMRSALMTYILIFVNLFTKQHQLSLSSMLHSQTSRPLSAPLAARGVLWASEPWRPLRSQAVEQPRRSLAWSCESRARWPRVSHHGVVVGAGPGPPGSACGQARASCHAAGVQLVARGAVRALRRGVP